MTGVLGLPLEEALKRMSLEEKDIEITRTGCASAHKGRERVVRVSEDGRRWIVACFPDGDANLSGEE